MQYSKRRVSWFIEPLCPASGFVTADNYDSRIPPHAILPTVVAHLNEPNGAKRFIERSDRTVRKSFG